MSDLRVNTKVRISAPGRGACIGCIEDIRLAAEMPELLGFEATGEFAPPEILREWGVSRVAAISYRANPDQTVMFAAFEIAGEWYDLQRQPLTLEIVGQYT